MGEKKIIYPLGTKKNHATSWDQKNHANSWYKKSNAISQDKKRYGTSWDKKNHATSWDKKITYTLETEKSRNLVGQKITQPLGTKRNYALNRPNCVQTSP